MKIRVLNLEAFGPFTDSVLDFSEEGLHVVYGPNEAGKSSALRALKALLYGIEERTTDNYLHANDKLRIGGCLSTAGGTELRFVRRKGRKNTLLDPEGETLDEQILTPFLQGVTPELFQTLFGIDHRDLIRGGQEILEQKGEVGQALFSAALGSHALHGVLAQLDEEADALFRPRGSSRKISLALKQYSQLGREIRECSLSSREWDDKRRALERVTRELQQTQSALVEARGELSRLQRIQRVLPKLTRRRELMHELEALGEVVVLGVDFARRHQHAVQELERAQVLVGKLIPRIQALQEKLSGLSINRELLGEAEAIEELHAHLGAHRKALKDRPHLDAQRQQLLRDAESILKGVRPDLDIAEVDVLRPVLARRAGIMEHGNQRGVLKSRLEQADSNRRNNEIRLKEVRRELQELGEPLPVDGLRREIASARKRGNMDELVHSTRSDLAILDQQCRDQLARLTLWAGDLGEVPRLAVPNRETIDRFEHAYDELGKQLHRLEDKKAEITGRLQEIIQKLDEMQRNGTVPTESDLVALREERDMVWRLLRRQWDDGADVSAEAKRLQAEGALTDLFETRLVGTDEVADRLRREAEQVHALASLQSQHEVMQRQTAETSEQLGQYDAEWERLDDEWRTEWTDAHIAPRPPREMRAWLDALERLRERVEQLYRHRHTLAELERTREQHIRLLNEQLTVVGRGEIGQEQLEPLLSVGESVAAEVESARHKRETLAKEIKARELELDTLTEEHRKELLACETWAIDWDKLMQTVGFRPGATPSEAADFVEKIRETFAKHEESDQLGLRIGAIDAEAENFRKQVADLVKSICPALEGLPAEEAAVRLNVLLAENRIKQSEQKGTGEALEQAQQELQETSAIIKTMDERLDALCKEASCDNRAELEARERSSAEFLRLKSVLASLEDEIRAEGEGANLARLEMEVAEIDADQLPACIDGVLARIDELDLKRNELAEAKGRHKKELEIMDGSDRAALLADEAQAVLATIRTAAERYVRAKLASRVLRDQIERYRKENQGPLVQRASEHFSALTLNSFERLTTDFNEKDQPVLAGVRPSGDNVYVKGMSSGTRDQLYLALRLASLEKYMENAESMPFIVDDILVDFDDARSEAALSAMAVLAKKTQVILFTHHARLVEQAKTLQRGVGVKVHGL